MENMIGNYAVPVDPPRLKNVDLFPDGNKSERKY